MSAALVEMNLTKATASEPQGVKRARSPSSSRDVSPSASPRPRPAKVPRLLGDNEPSVGYLHVRADGTTKRIDAVALRTAARDVFGPDAQIIEEDDRYSGRYRRLLVAVDENAMADKPTIVSEFLYKFGISFVSGYSTGVVIAAHGDTLLHPRPLEKLERSVDRERRREEATTKYGGENAADEDEDALEAAHTAIEEESDASSSLEDLVSDEEEEDNEDEEGSDAEEESDEDEEI